MDELKQQFYEVMHKYQKPFSEEGVTANLTQWSEQKQGLLQLLRRHPIWNEKELAIVFRVEERREIDRITVDETRAAILELGRRACTDDTVYENFETALRAATADYARIPNEYRLDTIRQYGGIKCAPGQKASRIINRLCLKFHLDQIEEEAEAGEPDNRYMRTVKPYNALFARLADALNPAHIEKTAVLSMIEGEWDEQRIKTALRQRFSVKETAPEREVLDKAFWELSQEIIDRGLPQVLQQAYDGKLTTDDYVALLGRLDDFRKIGVPIQCDVDDARMIQGFHTAPSSVLSPLLPATRYRAASKSTLESVMLPRTRSFCMVAESARMV